jgi:hypothetical protein
VRHLVKYYFVKQMSVGHLKDIISDSAINQKKVSFREML